MQCFVPFRRPRLPLILPEHSSEGTFLQKRPSLLQLFIEPSANTPSHYLFFLRFAIYRTMNSDQPPFALHPSSRNIFRLTFSHYFHSTISSCSFSLSRNVWIDPCYSQPLTSHLSARLNSVIRSFQRLPGKMNFQLSVDFILPSADSANAPPSLFFLSSVLCSFLVYRKFQKLLPPRSRRRVRPQRSALRVYHHALPFSIVPVLLMLVYLFIPRIQGLRWLWKSLGCTRTPLTSNPNKSCRVILASSLCTCNAFKIPSFLSHQFCFSPRGLSPFFFPIFRYLNQSLRLVVDYENFNRTSIALSAINSPSMGKILLDRRFESIPWNSVLPAKNRFLARFLRGTDTFGSKTESNKNMQAVSIFRVGRPSQNRSYKELGSSNPTENDRSIDLRRV